MSPTGDHVPEMPAIPLLDDDTIEAIIRGDDIAAEVRHLAAFATRVRAVGDGPAPRPSPALASLLAAGAAASPVPAPEAARPATRRIAVAKVAGLSIVAKLGLGVTAAAAGVTGAGAAGVLPGSVNHAVRHAIEVVTPLEFAEREDGDDREHGDREPADTTGERYGDRVSGDATGESDGDRGVDGEEISREAPGASHRPADTTTPGGPAQPGAPSGSHPTVEPGPPAEPGQPSDPGAPATTGPPTATGTPSSPPPSTVPVQPSGSAEHAPP